jgi:hypothetical protein
MSETNAAAVIFEDEPGTEFCEGEEVVLAEGTYRGTLGVFLRLRPDVKWADIVQSHGIIRSHPVAWLAHFAAAAPGSVK